MDAVAAIAEGKGWNACRAAMLQDEPVTTANKLGNSPVIPDGLITAVNRLLDSDGSRGCYSAIQCGDAHDEIERLLAAAPQEVNPWSSHYLPVTRGDAVGCPFNREEEP